MINEQIRDKEVRVIGPDGEQLGIMSAKEAYFKAKDANLDHRRQSHRYARLLTTVNTVTSWPVKQKKRRKNRKPLRRKRFVFRQTSTRMT